VLCNFRRGCVFWRVLRKNYISTENKKRLIKLVYFFSHNRISSNISLQLIIEITLNTCVTLLPRFASSHELSLSLSHTPKLLLLMHVICVLMRTLFSVKVFIHFTLTWFFRMAWNCAKLIFFSLPHYSSLFLSTH
jgi:hypothetical protein